MVDVACEVAAIADHLGLDRFTVWGISSGGAPAVACAAALPDRVVAAASLAGTASFSKGFDWLAGMGEYNVEDFTLMLKNQSEWERKSQKDAEEMMKASKEQLFQIFDSLLSDVDRSVLSDELLGYFQAQFQEAFKNGIRGGCDDSLASAKPGGSIRFRSVSRYRSGTGGTTSSSRFPTGSGLLHTFRMQKLIWRTMKGT